MGHRGGIRRTRLHPHYNWMLSASVANDEGDFSLKIEMYRKHCRHAQDVVDSYESPAIGQGERGIRGEHYRIGFEDGRGMRADGVTGDHTDGFKEQSTRTTGHSVSTEYRLFLHVHGDSFYSPETAIFHVNLYGYGVVLTEIAFPGQDNSHGDGC